MLVKIKNKYQITIPTAIRERVGVNIGDILEAEIEKGRITFTPKMLIDKRLAEAIEDIKAGRTYGPFKSVEKLLKSLRNQ